MITATEKVLAEIRAGTLTRSPETREMAKRAVEAMRAREGEDIEEWARRLADDVKDYND